MNYGRVAPPKRKGPKIKNAATWLPPLKLYLVVPENDYSKIWFARKGKVHCALVDLNGRPGGGGGDFVEASADGAGDVEHAFCADGVFAEERDGLAGVAADADARIDFDFAEDGDAVGLRGFRAFAVAEDVDRLAAVRAGEGAHIFYDAEDFDIDLAKHFDGLA